jgi:hypothetical protein
VLCSGPAGSGKTFLAVAMAVAALRAEQVSKIVLVRPAVEAGESLGYLPGDLQAKINPYLRPLLDALREMMDYEHLKRLTEQDIVEMIERESRRYELVAIEHPDHPDFERAYRILWDTFGPPGEMEPEYAIRRFLRRQHDGELDRMAGRAGGAMKPLALPGDGMAPGRKNAMGDSLDALRFAILAQPDMHHRRGPTAAELRQAIGRRDADPDLVIHRAIGHHIDAVSAIHRAAFLSSGRI